MVETLAEFCKNRAAIYNFLSAAFRDEIPKELLEGMKKKDFVENIKKYLEQVSPESVSLLDEVKSALEKDTEKEWKELRYTYADIFLNAGVAPVFPYESSYFAKEPVVMQKPVFEVREYYRKAGVHKADEYLDLDDHIAVEFEFMRYLCENCDKKPEFVDLQAKFIQEHFYWIRDFCDELKKYGEHSVYKLLADLTSTFISLERAVAGVLKNALPKPVVNAVKTFAEAVNALGLSTEYVTIKEGVKPREPKKEIPTHCYICGGLCGMTAITDDGIITGCKGLPGDPKSGGAVCIKGTYAHYQTYSAYRLKWPLIKENGRFRKATWEEALDKVAELMKNIEPTKVGFLRGNDLNRWCTEAVMKAYGAPMTTHRPMCDNSIRMANEHNLNDKRPWIDYRESDYVIFWGCNELVSSYGRRKVTFLREAVKRGAKVVVIDTRYSDTAELAQEWIPIKPGTDAAMALAMAYVILKNDLYDKEFVENWTYGFEEFKKRVLGEDDGVPKTPEWAEKICGVPAQTIERIALEFATAKHPAIVVWAGIAQCPQGFYTTQSIEALNALLGTFDAPGGPSLPFKRKLKKPWTEKGAPPAKKIPKPNKFKMWTGWAPGLFAQDVENGVFEALFCYFGDPVLSWSNEDAVVEALKKLKFIVTIDAFMSNIAVLSDVVLPEATFLEQDEVRPDWLFDAFIALRQKVVDPMYNSKPGWWIFIQLADRLGFGEYFPWKDTVEPYLKNMLKGTPWDWEELKKKGYIITDKAEYYKYKKWGSLNPPEGYGSSGKTKTGKYNFKNPVAEERDIDPLPAYVPIEKENPDLLPDDEYPFIMQNFRVIEHEHSSTFFNIKLMKLCPSNPVWINPLDAKKLGINTGDKIIVESPWGKVEAKALVTWKIMPGVVGAAGGFGHWRGPEADPRFPEMGGFNVNKLSKPNLVENYGGNPVLKYIKVRIKKAE